MLTTAPTIVRLLCKVTYAKSRCAQCRVEPAPNYWTLTMRMTGDIMYLVFPFEPPFPFPLPLPLPV